MAEKFEVKLNNVARFDEVIKTSLRDLGDVELITKDGAMEGSGRAGVMLTFTVELPDGSFARVQTVTSMRMFRAVANAIVGSYSDDGYRVNMVDPLDDGVIDG